MKDKKTPTQSTLERLIKKAESSICDSIRIPSITQLSAMLTEFGIEHKTDTTQNVVEYRSAGKRYVNSRHDGKRGTSLKIDSIGLHMDTSDSYYSWNTNQYARELVKLLKEKVKSNNISP